MALGGGFRTRSGNSENAPNMSFGSNGVRLGAFISKNSTATFIWLQFALDWPEWPYGACFARVFAPEAGTTKTNET